MRMLRTVGILLAASVGLMKGADAAAPKAGPVELYPLANIKPGQMATAWTVFQGTEPESVPIEIVGVLKNGLGPKVDLILGKMLGKAKETNVAAGMSGSPVYIDGKLVGAVSLRMGAFSPDAVCGITPIQSMLEINALDQSRPSSVGTATQAASVGPGLQLVPIETPLMFSGVSGAALKAFEPQLRDMGITPVQGGSAANTLSALGKSTTATRYLANTGTNNNPQWDQVNLTNGVTGVPVSQTTCRTLIGTDCYNNRDYRETDFVPYIQDDWKVNAKLTLNMGIRYEFATNPVEIHNGFYAVTDYANNTALVNVPNANFKNPNKNNWDPRFGFAYDMFSDHKTALRGGFAITHSPV